MTLRTDDELNAALEALAEAEGTSKQDVVRRAVLERYERAGHRKKIDEAGERLRERWSDVLDRLGAV